jgi:hypothetical protein
MDPILADTLRFRTARLLSQRNMYLNQRDSLADAIDHHRLRHAPEAHEADNELWNAYLYVMSNEPKDSGTS